MGVAAVVGGAGDDDFGRREFGVQAERVRQLGVEASFWAPTSLTRIPGWAALSPSRKLEKVASSAMSQDFWRAGRRCQFLREPSRCALDADMTHRQDLGEALLVYKDVNKNGDLTLDALVLGVVRDVLAEEASGFATAFAAFRDQVSVKDAPVSVQDAVGDLVSDLYTRSDCQGIDQFFGVSEKEKGRWSGRTSSCFWASLACLDASWCPNFQTWSSDSSWSMRFWSSSVPSQASRAILAASAA